MNFQPARTDLTRTYTAAEFEQLPDDGNRYDLIDGKLHRIPEFDAEHAEICDFLYQQITAFDPEQKLGRLFRATGILIDNNNVRVPDLTFVTAQNLPSITHNRVLPVTPDLVIEVWARSQFKKNSIEDAEFNKIHLYRQIGVKMIWAINSDNFTAVVFQPIDLLPVTVIDNGNLDGENILPGFKLAVMSIFE
jgi:Uma2 family endonuclease